MWYDSIYMTFWRRCGHRDRKQWRWGWGGDGVPVGMLNSSRKQDGPVQHADCVYLLTQEENKYWEGGRTTVSGDLHLFF